MKGLLMEFRKAARGRKQGKVVMRSRDRKQQGPVASFRLKGHVGGSDRTPRVAAARRGPGTRPWPAISSPGWDLAK